MKKKRTRRFGVLAICWAALAVVITLCCAAAPGGALEEAPDLSQIESRYILPENQTLLPAPDGGYYAVTTDGTSKTYLARLTASSSGWQVQLVQHFSPAYQRVLEADASLYFLFSITDLMENGSSETAPAIQATRYHIETGGIEGRIIRNAVCDFERTCRAEDGGKLFLVTAPPQESISDSTLVSVYLFDGSDYELDVSETLPQEKVEEPDPSEPSVPEPTSSEQGSSSEEDPPVEVSTFLFSGPVTVSDLEQSYTEHTGGTVQVTAADGTRKLKGRVVTGDVVDVWIDGRLDSRVIACIPGDLTGRGRPDSSDVQRLYEYLTNNVYLDAAASVSADLTGDGALDTGDLLLLKNLVFQKS